KLNLDFLIITIERQHNPQKKDLLIRFLFLLLDNAKIAVSSFGGRKLVDLMEQLDSRSQKKLANHPNLSIILSPLEIEDLKRKIV
ncbi:hypothetical protein, partial [Listeria costaricensis]|uniref:hypothetical protein n=1 Tax=Listeria costaricensis TaxID=2026604 RepID=UPI0013C43085